MTRRQAVIIGSGGGGNLKTELSDASLVPGASARANNVVIIFIDVSMTHRT